MFGVTDRRDSNLIAPFASHSRKETCSCSLAPLCAIDTTRKNNTMQPEKTPATNCIRKDIRAPNGPAFCLLDACQPAVP
ncbi:hypothetical protein HZH66_007628 [Vespula vulgaris]|uniref:Uncharacterized protein n=1 Tax=Vespula vulgaris TaxID=7454 RepID=A0A834K3U0_VESVU|nr:hypothetical protein HZH66_007628 [Vespula vulgaris]